MISIAFTGTRFVQKGSCQGLRGILVIHWIVLVWPANPKIDLLKNITNYNKTARIECLENTVMLYIHV